MTLNENIQVSDDDNNFKEWLLNIGEDKRSNSYEEENELIHIPDEIMTKEEDIITEIYGNEININDKNLKDKIILAPKTNDVININNEILNRMEGDTIEYLSIDTAEDDNEQNLDVILPTEFLNSLTPNGLPLHKLK